MKTISPAELQTILLSDPTARVLDVRTPVEFAEVHVPQAELIPLDELKPESLSADKSEPIYLLCRSGGRATKAGEKLQAAGFEKPIVVTGGTLAWIEANLPVTRGQTSVVSLERQVRIAAGSLVLLGVILAHVVHGNFIYLSGFVGAGLIFAGVTDWCGMGLLLAKAPWNKKAPANGASCAVKSAT